MHLRLIHVFPGRVVCSFLLLSTIPWHRRASLFTHSSVEGHLSCFQVLVIVNKAAVNIYLQVSFPLGKHPGASLLGRVASACLTSKGTAKFPKVAVSVPLATDESPCCSLLCSPWFVLARA